MTDEIIVVEGDDAIEHFRLCQCIAALSIEVRTGLSHSRASVLAHVQRTYGVTERTKKGALDALRDIYLVCYGREYGKRD